MYPVTVFTTTYNRSNLLKRVYKSLLKQTNRNFEWLVVDDGSTDNTKELVESWIEDKEMSIKYIFKENGGVHTARNVAYNEIQTELCFQVDSDDWLSNDAVEITLSLWGKYGGDKVAGIVGLCSNSSGELIGSKLPDLLSVKFRELNTKYKVTGDKCHIFKTKVMKNIPDYPVFEGENRVPIAWKYSQIQSDQEVLLTNKILCIVEYQPEGISAGIRKQYFKNPKGMAAGYEMVLKNAHGLKQLIKSSIGYVTFGLMAHNNKLIQKSPKPISTLIFYPFGLAGFIYIHVKWGKLTRK